MLTQREKDFIVYWEANSGRRKKVVKQFLIGIPIGLAFAIPILINFGSHWYRRADMEANNPQDFNPMVLLVALLLIVGFVAIFWQRHLWDQYQQRYLELKAREDDELHEAQDLAHDEKDPAGTSLSKEGQPLFSHENDLTDIPPGHQTRTLAADKNRTTDSTPDPNAAENGSAGS